jgi:hypothetical protein
MMLLLLFFLPEFYLIFRDKVNGNGVAMEMKKMKSKKELN